MLIEKFLDMEVLLMPDTYKRLEKYPEKDINNLISKIRDFKKKNDKFILLDNHFLEVFLTRDIEEIKHTYENFDFISYYVSSRDNNGFECQYLSENIDNAIYTENNDNVICNIIDNKINNNVNIDNNFNENNNKNNSINTFKNNIDNKNYSNNLNNELNNNNFNTDNRVYSNCAIQSCENEDTVMAITTKNYTSNVSSSISDKSDLNGIENIENKLNELYQTDTDENNNEKIKEREERIRNIRKIKSSINKKITYYAKDIPSKIHVYKEYDISGKSTCTGSINDFVKYFQNRYEKIKKMIERKVNRKAYPLNKLYKMKKESDVFIVGIVSDISETKKGHKRIEIEDKEGSFTVILMKDKIEDGTLPKDILLDEVIGFRGYIPDSGNVMFVNECIRPDITPKKVKSIDEQIYCAFLSDIHIGSYEFMEKSFKKFIEFLNGNTTNGTEEKIVSRLKYISIAGDLVDGVGIYPGQEYDLYEVDILSQYGEFVEYLYQLPEHIQIIISPGNHDALRPAEPQPIFPKRILKLFDGLKDNITFVSNPGFLNVHGLEFLLYHGRSFDDVIGQIATAKYTDPPSIMKELLKRRHLCPTYGGRCPIAPEHEDYLVIHNEPDVFHTGHIHINGFGTYKGTVLINSGTFQEQTDFQKKMGIHPTPARVPILDFSNPTNYILWNNGSLEIRQ